MNNSTFFNFNIEGELYFEDINLKVLAQKTGTPILLYFVERIHDNINWLRNGFQTHGLDPILAYPVKACQHKEILSKVQRDCTHCEVMTELEYDLAQLAGFSGTNILLNGFAWPDCFLSKVIRDNVFLINVDNLHDLERINFIAKALNKIQKIGLRIIPEISFNSSGFVDHNGKLGLPVNSEEEKLFFQYLSQMRNVELVCISAHILHRESNIERIHEAWSTLGDYCIRFCNELKMPIEYIDFGGGFDDKEMFINNDINGNQIGEIAYSILQKLPKNIKVILEPGRFIIGDAGVALTEVKLKKKVGNIEWLIVDISSNILIPIPASHFEIFPIQKSESSGFKYSIADNICSPLSIVANDIWVPDAVNIGDLLAIGYVGSYTFSMVENWGYPCPKVAIVDRGNVDFILTDETAKDIFYKLYT
jgi:diaminopimelate decarboxylase